MHSVWKLTSAGPINQEKNLPRLTIQPTAHTHFHTIKQHFRHVHCQTADDSLLYYIYLSINKIETKSYRYDS